MVSETFEPARKEKKSNKHSRVTKKKIQSTIQAKDSKQKWSTYSLEYRTKDSEVVYTQSKYMLKTQKDYKRLQKTKTDFTSLQTLPEDSTRLQRSWQTVIQ